MKALFKILFILFLTPAIAQSDYYWVGGSGSWGDLNHWATTSGGSTNYGVLPGSDDRVIFDSNSFSADGQSVTLDVTAICDDMDWTGISFDVSILEGAEHEIQIHGSVVLSNLVEIGNDVDLTFLSANSETFSMGDNPEVRKNTGNNRTRISFEGDGDWTIVDHLTSEGTILVQNNATLNLDGKPMYTEDILLLGASTFNSGTDATITFEDWRGNTNMNFGSGTELIMKQFNLFDSFGDFNGGGHTYPMLRIENPGQTIRLDGSNTFDQLIIDAGVTIDFQANQTQTMTALQADGTKFNFIKFRTDVGGTQATINVASGTVNTTYLDLTDMIATGGATFNATNSIDGGNNSGWNITAPTGQDYFWVGDGGEWTDLSHWATTSGGTTFHSELPGSFDNVIFDENSFSLSNQEVTDNDAITIKDLDFSAATNSPTLSVSEIDVFGSISLSAGVKVEGNIELTSIGSETITSNGSTGLENVSLTGSGTYTIRDEIHFDYLTIYDGALIADNQSLDVVFFKMTDDFGSENGGSFSAVNTNMSVATYQLVDDPVHTFTGGTLTIQPTTFLTGAVRSIHSFEIATDNPVSFGNVVFKNQVDVYYASDFTVNEFSIDPGVEVVFQDVGSSILNIDDLVASGTSDDHIIFRSLNEGTPHLIASLSGNTVNAEWLELKDSQVSGATFNATNSYDNGNNTGWTITAPPNSPAAPSNLVSSNITSSGFTAQWDAVDGADSYRIDLDNFPAFATPEVEDLEVTGTSHVFTGLNDADEYHWRVRAVNVSGTSSNSVSVSLTTLPVTPVALDGESVLSDRFTAKWEAVDGADNYRIDVSNNAEFSSYLTGFENLIVDGISQLVDGLNENQTYYYRVRAENTTGQTPNSNVITVSTGAKQNQTISFDLGADANKTLGDADFTLAASATSGLEVSFSSSDETVATVSGNVVSIVGSGTTTLTASQAGNSNFNAAPSVEQLLTVGKASQTITFDPDPIPDQNLSDGSLALDISVDTGLPLTVSILSGDATIVESSTQGTYDITYNSSGTVTIEAAQAGDDDYASTTETISFNVIDDSKSDQTITFDLGADQNKIFGDDLFSITATASSGLPVTFMSSDESVAIVSGSEVTIVGAGTTSITASQSGDDEFNPATPVSQTLTVGKADQTISFSEIADKSFGDSSFELEGTATSGLPITYTIENTFVAEVDENTVTIKSAGSTNIIASQAGDDNYNAAIDVTQSLQVNKAAQVITFNPSQIEDKTPDADDFSVTISNSSGLTPDVSSNDIISLSEGTSAGEYIVSILSPGEAVISVSQSGNSNYLAVEESLSFNIAGLTQEITFEEIPAKTFGDDDFEVSVSASSGLSVELESSNLDVATISGKTISIVGAGTATITASQSGDEEYSAATSVSRELIVNKADQTISFAELDDKTFGDENFDLQVSASSGLPVDIVILDESVAEIDGQTITIKNAGSTNIIVSQSGNENFNAAASVNRTLTVQKAPQVITFNPAVIADLDLDFDDFFIQITNSSGLTPEVTSNNVIELSEGPNPGEYLVSLLSAGDAVITVTHPGNDNYLSVEKTLTFGVGKLQQEITFDELPDKTFGEDSFEVSATASSGLQVTLVSSNQEVAIVEGLTVTIVGAGTTTLTASQEGDATYSAATEVSQVLTVSKGDQTITFDDLETPSIGDVITLSATASSGLEVSFEVEGPASLDGNSLAILDQGTVTITASQQGDDNWNQAEPVSQTLEITATALGVLDETISIFPNPFINILNLDYHEPVNIRIYALDGSVVWSKSGVKDQMEVSSLDEGMYILEVEIANEITRLRIKKAN
ncbi:fibronectin type III domain-containing protein [Ekhidna sp.]|uniref:fibronectin type III domain-containing protein n=1 Tax=Ekhidna sp. TaxID=2608089 RepID=UPI003CCC2371